jgi:hypothetical protein
MWGKVQKTFDPGDYSGPIPYTVYHFMGPDLRRAALRALLKISPDADQLVAALVEGLENLPRLHKAHTSEPGYCNVALKGESEGYIEWDVERYVEDGSAHWERKETEVAAKLNALATETSRVLAGYGPKARLAVPVLTQIATGELGSPRKAAPGIVPGDEDLLPPTTTVGADSKAGPAVTSAKWLDRQCRLAAIGALGAIASATNSAAVEALRTVAALDADPALRRAAAQAVAQIRERQGK